MSNLTSLFPANWSIASISELAGKEGIFIDGDWVESKDQDPNGKIRLLQLADIGDGVFLNKSNRWINEEAFVRLRCTEVIEGDVLIARMPDPLGRACILPLLPNRAVTVVDVAIIRCSQFYFYNRWLMHWINSPNFRGVIGNNASGTTRKRIARGRLGELEIPIPPLAEQRRIAHKLDTTLARVDALNDRLARISPLLKRFRQSVLAAATSGRLTEDWRASNLKVDAKNYKSIEVPNPYSHLVFGAASWKSLRFDEAINLIGGSQPPKSVFSDVDKPGYIRLIQIRDYKSDKHITFIPRELARKFCSKTDVMIGRYGPPIFQILRGLEGAYNVALMKAVPVGDILINDYLYYFLQNYNLLKYVEAGSDRTAGQDGVNKDHLNKYPVFVPSIQEQTEIVRRVETLFAFADRLEARLQSAQTAAERLTPALLAKAFRGELLPQDPNDEPATELLRRLREARAADTASKPKRGRKSGAATPVAGT